MKSNFGELLPGEGVFGPATHDNPYPVYAKLRDRDPVHWDESLHAWVLTRYDDVAMVLNDARFSAGRVSRARSRFDADLQPLFDTLGRRMTEYDGEDHKRLRALVHDAFTRTAVETRAPRIRELVDGLLAEPKRTGRVEFIAEVATPLPVQVILELVGISPEDRVQVKRWCDDFANVALNFYANISRAELQQGLESVKAFRDYLRKRVAAVEESPGDDLLSALVRAEQGNARLTLDELLANALVLLAAGNETTTCVLGNGLYALLRFPDQYELLRNDPSLIPRAVEEFLRYESPVQFLGRFAAEGVELHGKAIREGDLVIAVIGAANRDPNHFENPDRFDLTREHNHHLAFGHGQHYCLGAQLARLESHLLFAALLKHFSAIELDTTEPLRYRPNFNIRCLRELPIRLTAS